MAGMGEKVVWLAGALLLYVLFCLYWTWTGWRRSRAGHPKASAPTSLALTGAALAGWMFIAHFGLIYTEGLPYAAVSLACIVLPLIALLLFQRIGALAEPLGSPSFPALLHKHFDSTALKLICVLVGLAFSLIVLASLTRAGGALLNLLSDDVVSTHHAMLFLTVLILLYAGAGGAQGVYTAARVQFVLFLAAIILCGAITIFYIGSLERLHFGLSELARLDENRGPNGYSHYIATPGFAQFVLSAREAVGSPWTGLLAGTTLLAFAGIFTSPVYLNWVTANPAAGRETSGRLASRQIWTTAVLLGFLLITLGTLIGLGGHILGANMVMTDNSDDAVYNVMGANLGGMDIMETFGQQNELVPILISLTGDTLPWLFGLLALCAVAAVQCTAGALLQGAASLAAGDLIPAHGSPRRLLMPLAALMIAAAALILAWGDEDMTSRYLHLALAWSVQLLPVLLALCYFSSISGTALAAGILVGLAAAFVTDEAGIVLLGIQAWGGWPLSAHAGAWGLLANVATLLAVQPFTLRRAQEPGPEAGETASGYGFGLLLAVLWFAVPLCLYLTIGDRLFGVPDDSSTWLFGLPSLWAWQIVFWLIGVAFLWHLSRRQT